MQKTYVALQGVSGGALNSEFLRDLNPEIFLSGLEFSEDRLK